MRNLKYGRFVSVKIITIKVLPCGIESCSEGATSVWHVHNRTATHTDTETHRPGGNNTVARAMARDTPRVLRHFLQRHLCATSNRPLTCRSKVLLQKTLLKKHPPTPPLFLHSNRRSLHNKNILLYRRCHLNYLPPPSTHLPALHESIQVPQELKPFTVSVKKGGSSHNPPPPELKTVACCTGFREIS